MKRILAFIIPVLFSLPHTGFTQTMDWQIECVDCPRQFSHMTDRSLSLDQNGYPHIA